MLTSIRVLSRRARVFVPALLALGSLEGCRTAEPLPPTPPTRFDHLVQWYPELRSGRFVIIADFEDDRQQEIFHVQGVSGQARCRFGPELGRPETGSEGLLFTTASPEDTLVIAGGRAKRWYLKRDWREYDLLLMSLAPPQPDLAAEITIAGGPAKHRVSTHATVPLRSGWNVLRLDLAEIGERVPLDDVRELRLAVSGMTQPVSVRVDDVLLSGNRQDLFGDSSDAEGGLYVQRVGRRWRVGTGRQGARFELAFANGQVVEWYNTAADPMRLRNLVRGAALGPMPILLDSARPGVASFPASGKAVAVRSRIVEANAVRAVVDCAWYPAARGESAEAKLHQRPLLRWVYTIYATGQLYVTIESDMPLDTQAARVGLGIPLTSWPEAETQTFLSSSPTDRSSGFGGESEGASTAGRKGEFPEPVYGTARLETGDAFLLFAVYDTDGVFRMMAPPRNAPGRQEPPGERWLAAVRDGYPTRAQRGACHLVLGSSSAISHEEARDRARDYIRPAPLQLDFGSVVPPERGPPRVGGFDPGTGCHVIAPEGGRVRLVIDGARQPRFAPVFQILDTADREAWVYVDDRLLKRVARDRQGNLLFQLPGTIRKPAILEVLLRRRSGSVSG